MLKKHPLKLKPLKLAFVLLLIFSCGGTKQAAPLKTETIKSPKIIFLTYSISKEDDGKKMVELLQQKIVEGKIKTSESMENGKPGDLVCKQLNSKSEVLATTLIKDPLNKTVEFSTESMEFQTKSFSIEKTMFTLRMQLHHHANNITISTFADNKLLNKAKID
ncbi:hypothetical protein [Cognatitamlana onchidii]|uniref:hypothetical protein n=1 Tax=Cognatitamlana onchidii TaxID=2562860 RepID=UPI0010A62A0B|nr:hypothetical protein [Algibacter onchidii]